MQVSQSLKRIGRAVTSIPALTVFFIILVDIVLRQFSIASYLGVRSVDLWNVPARIQKSKEISPQVGLIGSSLLLVLNQDETGSHFYSGWHPPYFEKLLSDATGEKISCINLCSGLQMVYEAYMITQAITNDTKSYPKVLIYGIALRPFINEELGDEWNGHCFASVAPYVPPSLEVLDAMSSDEARKEFLLSHYWYLYRNKVDIKNIFSTRTKPLVEMLPLDKPFFRIGEDHKWKNQKEGFLLEEWVPNRMESYAKTAAKKDPEWLRKYYYGWQKEMYSGQHGHSGMIQASYLASLAKYCKRKGILLVVVNMPLDPVFIHIAPPGLYEKFRIDLHRGSLDLDYVYIDMVLDSNYSSSDFKDGLHLNKDGARRFAKHLVGIFEKKYPFVLEVMKQQAQEM